MRYAQRIWQSCLSPTSIPADPSIKNFSFANVDGVVYYRENSRMNRMELPAMTTERVLGMIELRDLTQELLQCQLEDGSDEKVHALQEKLNQTYDKFTGRYGLISSNANKRAYIALNQLLIYVSSAQGQRLLF